MQAREKQADSLYFYVPGTALLNPTYDHPASRMLAKLSKGIAAIGQPGLFTKGTDLELISFDDPRLPSSCKNFKKLYEAVTPDPTKRYYVQWNGDLGQTAWQKTATFMKNELDKRINARTNPDDPIDIYITAHSNGGQIARLLAEMYKDNPAVRFHMVTIEMPLSILPAKIMPSNVETWQHVYHDQDTVQYLGTLLMQAENMMGRESFASPVVFHAFAGLIMQWYFDMYTRRIEDLFRNPYLPLPTMKMPEGWKSNQITLPISDKHNDPINNVECANFCCDVMLKALEERAATASQSKHTDPTRTDFTR